MIFIHRKIKERFTKYNTWCQSWNKNKQLKKKLTAPGMWFWQRMLRISWIARLTNEVLERADVGREVNIAVIRKRQDIIIIEELENFKV